MGVQTFISKIKISLTEHETQWNERFVMICLGYAVLTVLVIFFMDDLFRLLTPLLVPVIILLPMFIVFLLLLIFSVIYIFLQFEKSSWYAFIPLFTNLSTVLIVLFFGGAIADARTFIGFYAQKSRYEQAAQWVIEGIQKGEIEKGWTSNVRLPTKFIFLAEDNKVDVTYKNGVINIFFYRGGGMFEYYPGYMFCSDNMLYIDGDIWCTQRVATNWFSCH